MPVPNGRVSSEETVKGENRLAGQQREQNGRVVQEVVASINLTPRTHRYAERY